MSRPGSHAVYFSYCHTWPRQGHWISYINGVSSSFTQIIKCPQSYCLFSPLLRFFSLQAQHLFSQSLGISAWRLVLTRLLPPFSCGYSLRTFLWPSSQLSHKLWELRAGPIWREWRILSEGHSPEGRSCKTRWAGRRVEKRRPLKPADTHLLPEAPQSFNCPGNQEVRTDGAQRQREGIQVTHRPKWFPSVSPETESHAALLYHQEIKTGRKLGKSALKGACLHANVSMLCSGDKVFLRQNGIHTEYNVLSADPRIFNMLGIHYIEPNNREHTWYSRPVNNSPGILKIF